MSPPRAVTTCEIYDQALKYSRDCRVPPSVPQPCYTSEWLAENISLLEKYRAWLSGGGTSALVIRTYHIPMAGHVLSMNHKPTIELDPDKDFQIALGYIRAKGLGPDWNHNCQLSLLKFRRFLLHERGQVEIKSKPYNPSIHTVGLPDWLVDQLIRFQHVKQRNWRHARIEEGIRRFWSSHLRLWRFLVEQYGIQELNEVKRAYFSAYIDWRLETGASVSSVNGDLRTFHGLMDFLQDQGLPVPHALQRLKCLKEPEPLPKFLTDAQVRALRDDLESRVKTAQNAASSRDGLLDLACFYLLWQAGLRKGEVEDLQLEDLDLKGRRLTVRRGKGMLDRTVFLTDTVVSALTAYLEVRGPGPTEHVFLYRNQALSKDLIHGRLKASGVRVDVPVYPHRLRHTCATQLLNAGCRITSIHKILGHKRLNTTLTYARVHDQTVADDYYQAMRSVEKRMELMEQPEEKEEPVSENAREQILSLTEELVEPELSVEARLIIAAQIRLVLLGEMKSFPSQTPVFELNRSLPQAHPPPEIMHSVAV